MKLISRENMSQCWRDPLHHLRHRLFKTVYSAHAGAQHRVQYATYCGFDATVDDINTLTMVRGMPTCLQCIIAEPVDDVIPIRER